MQICPKHCITVCSNSVPLSVTYNERSIGPQWNPVTKKSKSRSRSCDITTFQQEKVKSVYAVTLMLVHKSKNIAGQQWVPDNVFRTVMCIEDAESVLCQFIVMDPAVHKDVKF